MQYAGLKVDAAGSPFSDFSDGRVLNVPKKLTRKEARKLTI